MGLHLILMKEGKEERKVLVVSIAHITRHAKNESPTETSLLRWFIHSFDLIVQCLVRKKEKERS